MNYERIILELLERIQVLETKVAKLETQSSSVCTNLSDTTEISHKNITSKYRRLTEYLLKSKADRIILTYPEIEKILGFTLPESAHKHMRAYWSNSETHSYALSWLSIGYRTRVDIEESTVIFEKNLQI
ncbi:MAG: hypothetical protein E7363_00035 [Clostridiales bacterium]|nr:hypothetical protein [Clostridiales bacterium]